MVENVSAQSHRLYHLGSARLSRSNLSRINENKPYALYEALFEKLLRRCQGVVPGHNFRFKNPLYSLDASTIDLCLSVFPWAKFRTTKGAVKLHVGLNHAGYLPEFVTLTEGRKHDVTVARILQFPKRSMVVMDKAYNDYSWYKQLTDNGIFFVTRLKTNAKYRVIERREVLQSKGLTSDQTIEFTGLQVAKKCPVQLRRIGYRDPATGKHYVFLTNNFKLAARTIADIYKARWQVELFFKWIKQNLRVKTFYGTSTNAVKIQIWIAMIVYLKLAILKERYHLEPSLSKLLQFLEVNLFERKSLINIFQTNTRATHKYEDIQLKLFNY